MLYLYSDDKLSSFPSSIDFFASNMLAKTNIDGAENTTTVPKKGASIVGLLKVYFSQLSSSCSLERDCLCKKLLAWVDTSSL